MVTPMIITFREAVEAFIIIIPLLVYMKKVNRMDLSKFIYTGCISALVASLVVGGILFWQTTSLEGPAASIFEGSMMLFIAGLVLYNIIWFGKNKKTFDIKGNIENKLKINLNGANLFVLAFLTVFRETLEIILFLLPSIAESKLDIVYGILLGALIAAILMFLLFKTALKLNLNIMFGLLTVFLIFIGGEMFGEAITKFVPSLGESGEIAGMLVYIIPLLYLYLKKEIKAYIKKQ